MCECVGGGGYGECVSVWGEGGMVSVCVLSVYTACTRVPNERFVYKATPRQRPPRFTDQKHAPQKCRYKKRFRNSTFTVTIRFRFIITSTFSVGLSRGKPSTPSSKYTRGSSRSEFTEVTSTAL